MFHLETFEMKPVAFREKKKKKSNKLLTKIIP